MSNRVSAWAWEQSCPNAGAKLVLVALADHAGEDGMCYPSTGRIAERTGLSTRTVRAYIDTLDELGMVTKVDRRRNKRGELTVWNYWIGERTSDTPLPLDDLTSGSPLPSPAAAGCQTHRQPAAAHEPSVEPSVEPSLTRDASAFDVFWGLYPRRVAKPAAKTAFLRLDRGQRALALEGVRGFALVAAKMSDRDRQFIPYAQKWLRNGMWDDPAYARALESSTPASTAEKFAGDMTDEEWRIMRGEA